MEQYNILIVEDDKEIRDGIEIFLKSQNYNVFKAADGVEGLEVMEREKISLAIVDIMMPRMDGVTMTMKLREKYDFPVIMLSAKSEETDKVIGLNIGADDYVTKPFGIMELLSRIRSVLRRTRKPQEAGKKLLSFDGIVVDQEQHSVTSGGREVQLTLKEFDLLCYLLLNKGIVLSRDQIMQAVWDSPFEMESRTIDMHIMSLRQKLGNEGACIRTVRGVGYRLGDRKS